LLETQKRLKTYGYYTGAVDGVGAYALARLLKAFAVQVEARRRLRNGISQLVRVEHDHVIDGGQAIVGSVSVEQSC
jgi:hypothetical protein